jgi:hypothetical protein
VIRNDREYRETQRRLKEVAERLAEEKRALAAMGLDDEKVRQGLNPLRSFQNGLVAEAKAYERLKVGELSALGSLEELGRFLVEARVAAGITQRELARRLGAHETQVSRDEANDYYGATVARAARILAALGLGLDGRPVKRPKEREGRRRVRVAARTRAAHHP